MTAYHAIHESPYADDCPTCAGMDDYPNVTPPRGPDTTAPVVVAPWWMRLVPVRLRAAVRMLLWRLR